MLPQASNHTIKRPSLDTPLPRKYSSSVPPRSSNLLRRPQTSLLTTRRCNTPRRRVTTMSFLREALKGAKADIDSAGSGWLPRLVRTARVAAILGGELAAIVALAPYGLYAMSVYKRLPAVPTTTTVSPTTPNDQLPELPNPSSTPPSTPPDLPLLDALGALPPGRDGVAVHRNVRYGLGARNTLDVYVPLGAAVPPGNLSSPQRQPYQEHQQQPQASGAFEPLPVVFFVHGGVWASGETWQYAPMAVRLAQAGLLVVVPTYTLYPEALAGTMVEEVSAALSWTLDHVASYGGDPSRVTAAGHSAGGHLLAWALIRRAAAAEEVGSETAMQRRDMYGGSGSQKLSELPSQERQEGLQEGMEEAEGYHMPEGSGAHPAERLETAAYLLGGGGASLPGALHALRAVADAQLHPAPGVDDGVNVSYDGVRYDAAAAAAAAVAARPHHREVDPRMPAVFVGMSAVYDIAKHYEFEKARSVNELSMMKRAMGGPAGFAAASPSVILAAAAAAAAAAEAAAAALRRVGGNQPGGSTTSHPPTHSFFSSFELFGDSIPVRAGLPSDMPRRQQPLSYGVLPYGGDGAQVSEPRFSLAAARRLPPFVVMGSCSDHMVPWHEGAELVRQLGRCRVPVRHLLYNHVGHGDFVMAWRPLNLQPPTDPEDDEDDEDDEYGQGNDEERAVRNISGGNGGEQSVRSRVGVGAVPVGVDPMKDLLPCARDFLALATGTVRAVAERGVGSQWGAGSAVGEGSGMGTTLEDGEGAPGVGLLEQQGAAVAAVRSKL